MPKKVSKYEKVLRDEQVKRWLRMLPVGTL